MVEVTPIAWSVHGTYTGKRTSTVLTGEWDGERELHVSRLALPDCGVVARVVDVDNGTEVVRLGPHHAGHLVAIGTARNVALHVEPDGDVEDILARCGAHPEVIAAGIDIHIDSVRQSVPAPAHDSVESAAWVAPVLLGNTSPWLWHVSQPGADKIEIVVDSAGEWCGGLVTVTDVSGATIEVAQIDAGAMAIVAAGDWFAVRLESKCASEAPPVVVLANATTRIFNDPAPQLVDGPLEVFSDGAPWLSFHGTVPLENANDFGPFERIDLSPAPGQRLSISVPHWTPLACAPDHHVARYLGEQVCKPGASLVISPRPFLVRFRSGNSTKVLRIDAGLLIEGAASARPSAPERLGDTTSCNAPRAEQACMRLDGVSWAPRAGCRPADATGRDSDLDLLSDLAERCLTSTDPGAGGDFSATGGRDTDQDGFSDGWEVCGVADLGWNALTRRPTFEGGPMCRDLLYETLYDLTSPLPGGGRVGPGGYPVALDQYPVNTFEHLRLGVEPLFFNWLGVRPIRPLEDLTDPRIAGTVSVNVVADWAYVPAPGAPDCAASLPVCSWVTSDFGQYEEEYFEPSAPCEDQEAAHAAVGDPRCDAALSRGTNAILVRPTVPVLERNSDGECTCTAVLDTTPCDPATPPGGVTIRRAAPDCDDSVCDLGALQPDSTQCTPSTPGHFVDVYERRRNKDGTALPVYGTIIEELLPGVGGRASATSNITHSEFGRAFYSLSLSSRDRTTTAPPGAQRLSVAAHELGHVLGLGHGPFHPDSTHPAPLLGAEHPLYDSVMSYVDERIASARDAMIRYSAGQRARFDDLNVATERLLEAGAPTAVGYVSTFVRDDNTPTAPMAESPCSVANPCPSGYACVTNNHRVTAPQFYNPRDLWVCTNGALCEPDGAPCADGSGCRSTSRDSFFRPGECIPAVDGADLNGDGVVSAHMSWTDIARPDPFDYITGWSIGNSCAWNPLDNKWELLAHGTCDEGPSDDRTRVGFVRWEYCAGRVDPRSRDVCDTDSDCIDGNRCEREATGGTRRGICRPTQPERLALLAEIGATVTYTDRTGESYFGAYDKLEFRDADGQEHCVWIKRADRWLLAEHETDMSDFERMQFARIPFDLCGVDACEPGLSATTNLFRDFDYWPLASPGLHDSDRRAE